MAWRRKLVAPALLLLAAACGPEATPSDDGGNGPRDLVDRALNAPGFVTGAQTDGQTATFTWVDSNVDEDGYLLQRRLPNTTDWALIGIFAADTTTGTDSEITERATYFYRVVSYRGAETAPTAPLRLTFADATPPNTILVFHPPERTEDRAATFVFRSSEGAGTFTCEFDGEEFPCTVELSCLTGSGSCQSTAKQAGLADGEHTFSATAIDAARNPDPTPATFVWTIDTAAPTITLTEVPPQLSNDSAYSIAFTVNDANARTECQLGQNAFAPCTSPFAGNLGVAPPENNSVTIRASDELGNASQVSYDWNVDVVGPTVDFLNVPAALTTALPGGAGFTVRVGDALSQLSGVQPVMCTWSATVAAPGWNGAATLCATILGNHNFTSPAAPTSGRYTLTVSATDQWGNNRVSSHSWDVDADPPAITFTTTPFSAGAPPAVWGDDTLAPTSALYYRMSANEGVSYYCDLIGDAVATPVACANPHEFVGIAAGNYQAQITATDVAGNVAPAITHNVQVAFPAYDTDVCQAGGDVFFIDDFSRATGRDTNLTQQHIDPTESYLWRQLISPFDISFSYRLTSVPGVSLPAKVFLWGPPGNSSPTPVTAWVTGPSTPLCVNGQREPSPPNDALFGSPNKSPQKWRYEIGWYDDDTYSGSNPQVVVQTDRMGFAGAEITRLILRHRHPERGWLLTPGVDWQVHAIVDVYSVARPDTLVVVATAPEGDELTRVNLDFDDVHPLGFPNNAGRMDVTVEPPFCAGWLRVDATATPNDGNLSDAMKFPVLASGADDRYEPNDSAAQALANASVVAPAALPNLRLSDDDWVHFAVPTSDPVNVQVRNMAGAPNTMLYATLWEDNGGLTQLDADQSTSTLTLTAAAVDPLRDYFVAVTAASAPPCMRVRVDIDQ